MGSAVGAGALPLVAVLVLNATTLQVTLLAALSGIASAAIALPLGSLVEFLAKRPTMIAADLLRSPHWEASRSRRSSDRWATRSSARRGRADHRQP